MKIEISARTRDVRGTGASRRMRTAGRVPGILYGGQGGAVTGGRLPTPGSRLLA